MTGQNATSQDTQTQESQAVQSDSPERELYLDAAASDAVPASVIEAMAPFLTEGYGNPSSVHASGKTAARALDAARASFATDLGAHAGDVIFTSGGTEADNLAVKGIALAQIRRERETRAAAASASTPAQAFTPASASPHSPAHRILISAVEHPAVAQSAQWLHDFFDFEVVRIPVDTQAHIDLNVLSREAQKGATLACIMMANNEVGTIEPVSRAVRICHDAAVPVHVDAVQAAGTIPVDFRGLDADTLAVSGHKFGAPKGLGALLTRSRVAIEPIVSGGGQERGLRSGTPNVAGAIALAVALHEACTGMEERNTRLVASRDALVEAIRDAVPGASLTGDPVNRLPGHASFTFPNVNGEALLVDLDARGIEVSSGSACAIGRHEAPGTLLAMGLSETEAKSALRFSFREPLHHTDIRRIAQALRASMTALHAM
ncbi:cysteine desulfurase family protein [Bifidobacterium thermacidophilum]|uniref:Cysteine desulfurase n=1 Tax=Bifidobacterium thermacidophilum subsp. thermacidophilum TaxID=79262 RepID=A0A087E6K6_9BIFI|nr:cysteine desulfurase family protein [Bifidobacterium thermacidophilum]KFJ03407.1 Cysteine desulfurase [Bifidobacterium thermacidophilum subsp. thermacidophilum]